MIRIALAVLVALMLAAPARAGLSDPLPAPFTKHVFSVPGVVNDGAATVISCTNALLTSLNVGVEWFRKNGTSIAVSSLTIPAGQTRNFVSATVNWLSAGGGVDATMSPNENLMSGTARVLSTTSSGLLCNAYAVDASNNPPQRMMALLVTAPKKQKGQ